MRPLFSKAKQQHVVLIFVPYEAHVFSTKHVKKQATFATYPHQTSKIAPKTYCTDSARQSQDLEDTRLIFEFLRASFQFSAKIQISIQISQS